MVNIDAKVKDSNGDICRVECVYDDEILVSYGGSHAEDTDFLKHGTYTVIEDVRSELEQQKQRADELEKRWSELRNLIIDKAHFYENEGFMHQGAILVDVVEDMEQLEKENEG